MPNIMIHEKIGYDISKKIHIHSYDYYLGLLAPDAPNLNGFASKDERWLAHQRRQNYDEWRKSLDLFYQREKNNYSKDFLIGYYIHILTDIVYDDLLYLKVRERILDDYSLEDSHQVMRDDMDCYSFPEMKQIQSILTEKNDSYDILNISKETLLMWKKKQMSNLRETNNCKYLVEDDIIFLFERVLNEFLSRIEL